MFIYLDALFRANGSDCPLNPNQGVGGLFTSDTLGIRDVPPYLLDPAVIMVATSDGGAQVFRSNDVFELLSGLFCYLTEAPMTGNEGIVGWYLDQVVFPVMVSAAVRHGVVVPQPLARLARRLDDKWSKTMGFSLERALLQGWYPSNRNNVANYDLTLKDAVKMCGVVRGGSPENPNMTLEERQSELLMQRIMDISNLYARYARVTGVA